MGAPNATRGRGNETVTGYAKGKDLMGETVFSVGDEDEDGQYHYAKPLHQLQRFARALKRQNVWQCTE